MNNKEQKYLNFCSTRKIGNFRELRAKEFVIKQWKWNCYKASEELDRFHDVDLIAFKNNQLIFIQVKSLKIINKIKPSQKAICLAKTHNATLYYFFVGGSNERIYTKRIKWD